jgi:hypothetical protein
MIAFFVLIDALGWTYLQGRPFLDDLLPYRRPLRTVLGFSSGAIPTILTGASPAEHGHWNLFYYDPQNSPFRWLRRFGFLPDSLLDNRVSRKIIKELGRRVLGMGPLFECSVSPRLLHLFNWVEKRNIYDRDGITGAPSIFDQLADRGVPYRVYSYHRATDAEILQQAEADLEPICGRESAAADGSPQAKSRAERGIGPARFYFLYLSEMDLFLHHHCGEPGAVDEKIRWYEQRLRRLMTAVRAIDPHATLALFSDHGMTPVKHRYDLVGEIDKLKLSIPKDYLAVYDSTMARFWFFHDRARQAVLETLRPLSCGHLLTDDELRQLGVFFADRRYGEAVFLLKPGWLFSRSDFDVPQWAPVGMHGYHPDDGYSDGVFLAGGQPEFTLRTIQDVYRYMWDAANQNLITTQDICPRHTIEYENAKQGRGGSAALPGGGLQVSKAGPAGGDAGATVSSAVKGSSLEGHVAE